MLVHKVIMHHQDSNGGILLSEREMNLSQLTPVEDYIQKLSKSFLGSKSTTEIKLNEDSYFLKLINTQFPFTQTSQEIAKEYFNYFMFEKARNLILALVDIENEMILVGYEVKSQTGFVEEKEDVNGLENILNYNAGILSNRFTSVVQAFCLHLTQGTFKVKTKTLPLFEEFVDGQRIANSKDSFLSVDSIVSELAYEKKENVTIKRLEAKRLILDMEASDEEGGTYAIFADEIVRHVFEDIQPQQMDVVKEKLEEKGVLNPIVLENIQNNAIVKRHKIVTESGIEIILPVDSLAVEQLIDIDEDNGTITIRNTGKIL